MSGVVSPRSDLMLEVDPLLDSSGNYTSDWLDTSDVFTIRVACKFNGGNPTVSIDEGIFTDHQNTPKVVRSNSIAISSLVGYVEINLAARYFRLTVSGGLADNLFQATARRVP